MFNLKPAEAEEIIGSQVEMIREQCTDAADECQLTDADKQLLWERLILNHGVFQDEDPEFDTYGS